MRLDTTPIRDRRRASRPNHLGRHRLHGAAFIQLLRKHAAEFVGIQEVQNMLEQLEQAFPALVREVVPKAVSPFQLTDIIRRLVEEEISVRDLRSILQALAEWGKSRATP